MRARRTLRLQAALLVGLMTAVSSGLPSHHHYGAEVGPALADAGHHGHGTQIVEQSDRQTSEIFGVALPPPPTARLDEASAPAVAPLATTSRLRARGRSPPSSRPRAPPVSV
jgi:hypothetical protein